MVSQVVEPPMKVLVTGASGFIGSRFCRHLVAAGHRVVAVVRPRIGECRYPPGEIFFAQLPYGIPAKAFEGVECIVHCAGATTGQSLAEAVALHVETTRVLAAWVRDLPSCRRLIYLSSQSAHERAVSVYGRTKRQGEEVLRTSGVPYVIVRPGLVIGPGSEGLFARMRRTVDRLPVLPLLGGGRALVQPIDVHDLCVALEACLSLPEGESFEFNLGEPEPLTLAEFLKRLSALRYGRPKRAVHIPLAPLRWVIRTAELLRVPTPISKDNLEGMQVVQKMETHESLQRLGIRLTPLDEALKQAATQDSDSACAHRPVRVILVGAGKIGVVHALDLAQRPGLALVGLVDESPKASKLYHHMGFRVPVFRHIEQAAEACRPDAAIIATPAFTHAALSAQCLRSGLHVLVEKPLLVSPAQADEYRQLVLAHPDKVFHVGYMAAQFPQLDTVAEWLAEDRIGPVRSVRGWSLQSHITSPEVSRWETRKALAGGGVLVNFGCHALSILFRLFPDVQLEQARLWRIHSTEVEDAADIRLRLGTVPSRLVSSWSAIGYARPEMRLEIEGERGEIVLTNVGAALKIPGMPASIVTQRDFDVGFNPAPDYTGAAFACEHENFLTAIRRIQQPEPDTTDARALARRAVSVDEALRLESFIHHLYAEFPLLRSNDIFPLPPHDGSPACANLDRIVEGLR